MGLNSERGHTQLEADTVHSKIENPKKGRRIHLPSEYIDVIESARENRKYKVGMLEYDYFLDYRQLKLISSVKPGNDVTANNIHYLKYSNGEVYYKLNHKDDFQTLKTSRNPNFDIEVLPLFHKRLPITSSKYGHLQELATVIPTGLSILLC